MRAEQDEEVRAVWRRFMDDPQNRPAVMWLARLQGLNTQPEAVGAEYRIWMDNGARALIAEIFGMGKSKPEGE